MDALEINIELGSDLRERLGLLKQRSVLSDEGDLAPTTHEERLRRRHALHR
jgi:hypothetical protein